MLGKLIKYEFKATRKIALVFGLLIILAAMFAVSLRLEVNSDNNSNPIVSFIIGFAYSFVVAFTAAIMFITSIQRFRTNLLGSEGYLMHTLPVKTAYHPLAKNIAALVWTITGASAVMLSFAVFIASCSALGLCMSILDMLARLAESDLELHIGANVIRSVITLSVCAVISLSELYFRIYASMAAGYSINNHRAAASVGVFVLLSAAKTVVHGTLASALMHTVIFNSGDLYMCFEIIYAALWGLAYYLICVYFLSKRLNLQ